MGNEKETGKPAPNTTQEQEPEVTNTKIYSFMIMMLISGSINTIANKFQQNLYSLERKYSHPWFVTSCMFIGEATCLIWYSIYSFKHKKKQKIYLVGDLREDNTPLIVSPKKPEIKIWLIAIPAFCDFFGSTLMCLGLTMMAGSVYQMLRGSVILFTSLFSVLFLKRTLYRHNYLGIFLVVLGLVLVGCGALIELNKGAKTEFLGIVLVIAAQLFSATMFVVEEKLMSVYTCHPLKLVGFEGLFGICMYSILMVVFYFSPCPFTNPQFRDNICVQRENGDFVIEDIVFALRQLGNNGLLLFVALLYTLSISLFNFVGISITKYVSSAARAVVDSIRTVVVWVFFLAMPFVPESTKEVFSYLQFIGFIFLVFGTITFNEILVWPCWGFNMYTKAALKKKKEETLGYIPKDSDDDTETTKPNDESMDTLGKSKLDENNISAAV